MNRGFALLTHSVINNAITARSALAVGAASARLAVRVQLSAIIALLVAFTLAVAANRANRGINNLTVASALNATSGGIREDLTEGHELASGHALSLSVDNPLSVLSARWHSARAGVSVNTVLGSSLGDSIVEVNSDVFNALAIRVTSAVLRATVLNSVVVTVTVIAILAIHGISNTITTNGESAVVTASVIETAHRSSASIALFASIQITITAEGKCAVRAALVSTDSVHCAIIAGLASILQAVAAKLEASGSAASSAIALLTPVKNAIAAALEDAGRTAVLASMGKVVHISTIIALFASIEDAIAACRAHAVKAAAVGFVVVVKSAIIALLTRLGDAITATNVAKVADSVRAHARSISGVASRAARLKVHFTIIAHLSVNNATVVASIKNAITAGWTLAVAAALGVTLAVMIAIIAFFVVGVEARQGVGRIVPDFVVNKAVTALDLA